MEKVVTTKWASAPFCVEHNSGDPVVTLHNGSERKRLYRQELKDLIQMLQAVESEIWEDRFA